MKIKKVLSADYWSGVGVVLSISLSIIAIVFTWLGYDHQIAIEQRKTGGRPVWFNQLMSHSIIPGESIAGLKIGDHEARMIELLEQPLTLTKSVQSWVDPERNTTILVKSGGVIEYYATHYKYKGLSLNIYTHRNTRRITSFRLIDNGFEPIEAMPSHDRVSLGSHLQDILDNFGEPLCVKSKTCEWELNTDLKYDYPGITFYLGRDDYIVRMLDIRKIPAQKN